MFELISKLKWQETFFLRHEAKLLVLNFQNVNVKSTYHGTKTKYIYWIFTTSGSLKKSYVIHYSKKKKSYYRPLYHLFCNITLLVIMSHIFVPVCLHQTALCPFYPIIIKLSGQVSDKVCWITALTELIWVKGGPAIRCDFSSKPHRGYSSTSSLVSKHIKIKHAAFDPVHHSA